VKRLLVVGLCVLGASACATIIKGTQQTVQFESVPSGATVTVEGQTTTTPGSLSLARNRPHEVEISKPGYLTARAHLAQATNGADDTNVLVGGTLLGAGVGMLADQRSGARYDLDPPSVRAVLLPADGSDPGAP